MCLKSNNKSFTLIELLVVIAIIAILAGIVIVAVNPAKQLSQAKDTERLSNLRAIDNALKMFVIDNTVGNFGSPNTIHVSLPDISSICANLGLPPLPVGWTYSCKTEVNYKKPDGSGWLPVNLSPYLPSLPIDPKNSARDGLYYTYVTGSGHVVTSKLESKKFLEKIAQKDNGTDPTRYELGPDLFLWSKARGLVGYWKMDEQSWINNCSTLTVIDSSDKKNNGKSCPNGTGPRGGAAGKIGNAGSFDGRDDYLNCGNNSSLDITRNISIEAWIYPTRMDSYDTILVKGTASGNYAYFLASGNSYNKSLSFQLGGVGGITTGTIPIVVGKWQYVVGTREGNKIKTYIDGNLSSQKTVSNGNIRLNILPAEIGRYGTAGYFNGSIDELRLYAKALNAEEIKAIYEATK